jgi:hypothetical protein
MSAGVRTLGGIGSTVGRKRQERTWEWVVFVPWKKKHQKETWTSRERRERLEFSGSPQEFERKTGLPLWTRVGAAGTLALDVAFSLKCYVYRNRLDSRQKLTDDL